MGFDEIGTRPSAATVDTLGGSADRTRQHLSRENPFIGDTQLIVPDDNPPAYSETGNIPDDSPPAYDETDNCAGCIKPCQCGRLTPDDDGLPLGASADSTLTTLDSDRWTTGQSEVPDTIESARDGHVWDYASGIDNLSSQPRLSPTGGDIKRDATEITSKGDVSNTSPGSKCRGASGDNNTDDSEDPNQSFKGDTSQCAAENNSLGATGDNSLGAVGDDSLGAAGNNSLGAVGDDSVGAAGNHSLSAVGDDSLGVLEETSTRDSDNIGTQSKISEELNGTIADEVFFCEESTEESEDSKTRGECESCYDPKLF